MKSYFYGKDLATLHSKRAVRVRETKTGTFVEYIYKFNWPEETKAEHPEFNDYCVRCVGKNAKNVPFKAVPLDHNHGNKEGQLFFQNGPTLDTVNKLLQNPKAVYDMTKKDMFEQHIL